MIASLSAVAATVAVATPNRVLAAPSEPLSAAPGPDAIAAVVAPQVVGVDSRPGVAAVAAVVPAADSVLQAEIDALIAKLNALSGQIQTLGTSVSEADQAAINASAAQLSGQIGQSVSELAAQIEAQSARAVSIAEAASAAAVGAVQSAVDANTSAIAAAKLASDNAIAQLQGIALTILSIQSAVGSNTSSIQVQAGALSDYEQSVAGQLTSIQSTFNGNISSLTQSLATLSTAQSATATSVTALQAAVGANTAKITENATAAATATQAVADQVTTLQTSFGSYSASTTASLSALSSAQQSTAASLTSLTSQVGTNTATISSNYTTLANATQTVAGNLSTFQSTYNGQVASYNQTIATLTSAQQSTATSVSNLSASFAGAVAGAVGGGNDLANSDLIGYDGWSFTTTGGTCGPLYNAPGFFSSLVNTLGAQVTSNGSAQNLDWLSPNMPAEPGVTYEASIMAAAQGLAQMYLFVGFRDGSGTIIAYSSGFFATGYGDPSNANLANYARTGGFATAPSNAASRFLLVRTIAPAGNIYVAGFFTHPFSRIASKGQTILSPYSAGTQANVPAIMSTITSNATAAANATGAVAAQLNSLTSTYNGQVASFNSQIATLSGTQGTQATYIQTLQTNVGTNSSSISVLQSSVGGLSSSYVLALTQNGQTGGFSVTGAQRADGSGAVFSVTFDANVYINGNLVVAGTVGYGAAASDLIGRLTSAHNVQLLASPGSGIFTVPANVYWLYVKVFGGGGGGGAKCSATANYWTNALPYTGAGGGYSFAAIAVTPGQKISYTVGAGGAGGFIDGNGNAQSSGNGGTTSFGALSATGGLGGDNSPKNYRDGSGYWYQFQPNGGAGSGGAVNERGGDGNAATSVSGTDGNGNATTSLYLTLGGAAHGIPVTLVPQAGTGGSNLITSNGYGGSANGVNGGAGQIEIQY